MSELNEAYVAQKKEYRHNTELLSVRTKHSHEDLYQNYIKKLNKVSAELDAYDRVNEEENRQDFLSLKKKELYYRNAVYLHELYFSNISDLESQLYRDSLTYMKISRDFGTFDDWQYDFLATAKSVNSGWAICAYDTFLRRYHNFAVSSHNIDIPVGCIPIIVMDVWEHAYFRDYLTEKESYLSNMMQELNWDVIDQRVERAEMVNKVLER